MSPRAVDERPADGETLSGATSAAETVQVLLVDDEEEFLDLTTTFLEREAPGIQVTKASTASEALERLRTQSFDCVVSDYDMPVCDGLELLAAVREHDPALPFVLFTGKGSEEIASKAITAGVTDYLQKGGKDQYTLLANRVKTLAEKRRVEITLERRMQAIEAAREGIGLLDGKGQYIYLNRAYASMHGYGVSELLGRSWEVLSTDRDIDVFNREILPELEREGAWHGSVIGVRADGSTFPKDLSLTQLESGGHICIIKELDDDGREGDSDSVDESVLTAQQAGTMLVDGDRILAVGNGFLALTRYDRTDLVDSPISVLGRSFVDLAERARDTGTSQNQTVALTAKSDTVAECECRVAPAGDGRLAVLAFPVQAVQSG
ncbi:response regulator [Haloarchaeobius sp. TZWWS8]|uniref:response regulator n=1 Tax=Haloarchaeobius sp. TZWWS8 TaxID=3446121 RepID=UPI003EC12CF9